MNNIAKILLFIIITCSSCSDPYYGNTYQVYDVNPISAYLDTRSEDFSEWVKILRYSDSYNAINQATETFTAFVPSNEAVQKFYKDNGINSIEELGKEYARNLVKYHTIGDSVSRDEILVGGKLEKKTLSDDQLTIYFNENGVGGGGANSVYLNNEARITEMAIHASNGYVYVLDGVLRPLVESVYKKIEAESKYSIFTKLLQTTSWKDSLDIIYDTIPQVNGSLMISKRNFTVFRVSDDTYSKYGINSLEDLINRAKSISEEYDKSDANIAYQYAAYHIIRGNYSLSELQNFIGNDKKRIWETISGKVIEITEEENGIFKINKNGKGEIEAEFLTELSDVMAKNGVIHEVDGYMPQWESVIPTTIYFDFCAYPEVASWIKSNATKGQIYQSEGTAEYRTEITSLSCFTVEKNTSATPTSKYNYVDYFTVKSSNWSSCLNKDQLILNLGYRGSISMTTPTIIKGKYKVTLYFAYATSMDFMRTQTSGSNGGMMEFSFDGSNKKSVAPYSTVGANTLNCYNTVIYDEIVFDKTASHLLKMVVNDPAAATNANFRIQLDYLLFEPIID